MRILALNDTGREGGAAQLFRRTNEILRNAGHHVVEVTGEHLRPESHAYKEPFPAGSYPRIGGVLRNLGAEIKRVFASVRRVYHPKLTAYLDTILRDSEFDAVHIHNIHSALSTQILPYFKKRRIPIVYQVNDYYFFCNSHWAYNRHLDRPCNKCLKGNVMWALRYGCINGLGRASILSVAAETIGRFFVNATNRWSAVDLFIVTGKKASELLEEWGIKQDRQLLMRNPMAVSEFETPQAIGDEIVFYGTDISVKGVNVFLEALEHVDPGCRIGVYLSGMRPEYEHSLTEVADRRGLRLRCDSQLRWKTGLKDLLTTDARAIVVPSQWWSTSENVVYEGLLLGKPVITSDSGGSAELIDHGQTGFVFKSGDSRQLAHYINLLSHDRQMADRMGQDAYARARERFSDSVSLQSLETAYNRAREFASAPALER